MNRGASFSAGVLMMAVTGIFPLLSGSGEASAQVAQGCQMSKGRDRFPQPYDVSFAEGSAVVSEKDRTELVKVAARSKELHVQHICLVAQASKSGDAAANERLSRRRAEAVAAILKRSGVTASMGMEAKGEAYRDLFGFLPKTAAADRRVSVVFMQ